QKMNVKPDFMAHNFEGVDNVKEYLIDEGILEKPYVICVGPGMHKPSTQTYPDPWGMLYLINIINYATSIIPREDIVLGASIGGRNWLPITTLAIMLGVDFVRLGMEDAMHLYPHKDDLIDSCAQVTRKVANIARELGREIATPAEGRKLLALKKKKK
ncbi:MAG: 3-keto-5-aminohexanoate cleavage protein, partial [Chloroflexota bacterium]